jgi:hypothetical protein
MKDKYPLFNAMGAGHAVHDGNYEVADFIGFLEELVNGGGLEPVESGIAKQAMTQGTESLSKNQLYHLERIIDRYPSTCNRDGDEIPWNERIDAYDNGGLCSYCANANRD